MKEQARQDRNRAMLGQCYPAFADRLRLALVEMARATFRPRIQCAWRSIADQIEAYADGHSQVRFGFHNVTGARGRPEALAADVLDDDHPLSPPTRYLLGLAVAARAHGLETGILWGLTGVDRDRTEAAIATGQIDAAVKIGWDACHVQVRGMKPREAESGVRPAPLAARP